MVLLLLACVPAVDIAGNAIFAGPSGVVAGSEMSHRLVWLCPEVLPTPPSDADSPKHEASVKPLVPPTATFPPAALALRMKDEMCSVRLSIDEAGQPFAACIVVRRNEQGALTPACPRVFWESSVAGAMKSRFEPYEDDGVPTKVRFIWNFHYISK